MIRGYVIGDYLSEDNRSRILEAAEEYGYDISFYDSEVECEREYRAALSGRRDDPEDCAVLSGKCDEPEDHAALQGEGSCTEGPEERPVILTDGEVIYCQAPLLLPYMPHLRWCHTSNAGVDAFVKSGVFDSGAVALTNSSGAYGLAISEYVVMTALMLMKRMPEYSSAMERCEWLQDLPVRSVRGSRILVIGTGNIGSSIAEKFRVLGAAKVYGISRNGAGRAGFDEVLTVDRYAEAARDADVVVLCVPGTPDTEGILSRERIAMLPERAIVINVGRGSLTDQDALIEALNEGRIAGAALDVMMPEPLPENHPLRSARNCILTPHISGDTGLPATVDATVDYFIENMRRYAAGEPLIKRIDPERGY